MIYSAIPGEQVEVRTFFDTGTDSVSKLLENPGQLRYAGWDMQTLDRARIVTGEYLEVRNGDRKIIALYRDGTLIARVSAGEDFLGHASKHREGNIDLRINPIALVEFTYNFVEFYRKAISFLEPRPKTIQLSVHVKDAFLKDGGKLYLIPYGVKTWAWEFDDDKSFAPENDKQIFLLVDCDRLASDVAGAAYDLLKEIYGWFGLSADKIPYTVEKEGHKFVNPDEIKVD